MISFYQSHLDRVSRSFALCTMKLNAPLREWVSLTYLLCRLLDTIEDSAWSQSSDQKKQFHELDEMIQSIEKIALHVNEWKKRFPQDVSEGELLLIQDADLILQSLHSQDEEVRNIIQKLVQKMSAGMREFCENKKNGEMRLKDLNELNQYCYFVAGIVGETLHEFVVLLDPSLNKKELFSQSCEFGLFLQKVNILKDQTKDELQGRFLVPDRKSVVDSLIPHAEKAISYLASIPLDQKEYRLFCAISLFLGLSSLPYIQESYDLSKDIKISREDTLNLVEELESKIGDPDQINEIFKLKTRPLEL